MTTLDRNELQKLKIRVSSLEAEMKKFQKLMDDLESRMEEPSKDGYTFGR